MVIKVNETRTEKLQGRTIRGLNLHLFLEANVANTAITKTDLNMTSIVIKTILKRAGKIITICNDNLQTLALESAIQGRLNGIYQFLVDSSNSFEAYTRIANGASAKETFILPVPINFGGVINLKDSDELTTEITVNGGAWQSTISTTNSYLNLDYDYACGIEYKTPQIRSYAFQASITQDKVSLGDRVERVSFINLDKKSNLSADDVVTSVQLESDKLTFSANKVDFFAKMQLVRDATDFTNNFNNIVVYGEPNQPFLNGVQCTFNFTSANVTASKNFLVWRTFETSPELIARAQAMAQKHANENYQKAI